MKKIQTILAYDGTMFNTEEECKKYEASQYKVLSAALDGLLKKTHYSGYYTSPVPEPNGDEEGWRWGVCEMKPHVASILIGLTKIHFEMSDPIHCQEEIKRITENIGKVISVRNGIAHQDPNYLGFLTADELIGDILEYFNLEHTDLNFATTGLY